MTDHQPQIISSYLANRLKSLRQDNKKIVLVTGVFDLLHDEHRNFLNKAKEQADFLIVAIESDLRVKQLKGSDRPIWNQLQRQQSLQQVEGVDYVEILPEDFSQSERREQLIAEIKPDVLAVSSHSPNLPQKTELIEKYGGKVVIVHQHNPQVSTTQLMKKRAVGSPIK